MVNSWPYPNIVAHRGAGKLAPENTLAAIKLGADYGHKMVEFDAKLSAEGEIFLLHDDSLERTTNGHGMAGALSWTHLMQLDAGGWFSPEFNAEPLPLLSQVADCCARLGLMANIEIKPTPDVEQHTGEVIARAAKTLWADFAVPPLLSSFSRVALAAAQQAVPQLPRGLLVETWREDSVALAQHLGCVSLHIDHRALNIERVMVIQRAGLKILAYTVNHPHRAAQLLTWGVDCICTDNIKIIGPDFRSEFQRS